MFDQTFIPTQAAARRGATKQPPPPQLGCPRAQCASFNLVAVDVHKRAGMRTRWRGLCHPRPLHTKSRPSAFEVYNACLCVNECERVCVCVQVGAAIFTSLNLSRLRSWCCASFPCHSRSRSRFLLFFHSHFLWPLATVASNALEACRAADLLSIISRLSTRHRLCPLPSALAQPRPPASQPAYLPTFLPVKCQKSISEKNTIFINGIYYIVYKYVRKEQENKRMKSSSGRSLACLLLCTPPPETTPMLAPTPPSVCRP